MKTLESQLLALVHDELALPPGSVRIDSALTELGDSLDWLNLIDALETTFELKISDRQAAALLTLGDVLALIERHRDALHVAA